METMARPSNGFLSALAADDYELIRPHLRIVDLPHDAVLVEAGETGLLVPPGDPKALAVAIRTLLADPGEARRMVERARAMAQRRFSLELCLEAVEAVLAGVRDGKRSL